ncbi:hypothetical protein GN244_ATG09494 [Phytophthora infestans]|uniref:DUF659 domain-containing protein n=1 Tax=Phytophthora infestans TaxID=4787 RepID=A0A833WDP7_PHYIN|nr:hypothetical protein GN244_ATG09494 [Phytophthora infestans]
MGYFNFKMMMLHKLKGTKYTLNTDGWTDINGKRVIKYVLQCEGEQYISECVYEALPTMLPLWRLLSNV